MSDSPANELPCHHEGCDRTDTTPRHLLFCHPFDLSLLEALFRYGPKQAWQLWREGYIEVLDGYYCAEHAYEEGFCWGCGNFYAGASERFDFRIGGQWMCDSCWSNFQSEFEPDLEDEGEYYPGPWDE